jgi:hypothetical protein
MVDAEPKNFPNLIENEKLIVFLILFVELTGK